MPEKFGFPFLDASTHLYKRVCPSVRLSVGPSVTRFFFGGKWDFNELWTSPTLQISSGMNNNTVALPLSPPPPPKPTLGDLATQGGNIASRHPGAH